jgi:hypothetical protein
MRTGRVGRGSPTTEIRRGSTSFDESIRSRRYSPITRMRSPRSNRFEGSRLNSKVPGKKTQGMRRTRAASARVRSACRRLLVMTSAVGRIASIARKAVA